MLARLALVCLLAVGCAAPAPTPAEIAAADIGPAPDEEAARAAATGLVLSQLVDPGSAQIEFSELERGYYLAGGRTAFAWCLVVWVNARNQYGGYTGVQAWPFWFRDNATVAVGFASAHVLSPTALELDPPVPLGQ